MHALLARVASDDLGGVQTAVELAMDARELLAKGGGREMTALIFCNADRNGDQYGERKIAKLKHD